MRAPCKAKVLSVLKALAHLDDEKQRRDVLRHVDDDVIRIICECALNTLRGTVTVEAPIRRKLRKHADALRRLASASGTWNGKRRALMRGGEFLQTLLTAVLSKWKTP